MSGNNNNNNKVGRGGGNFKCRQCNSYTFGEPAERDVHGKPICKYCLEKKGNNKK